MTKILKESIANQVASAIKTNLNFILKLRIYWFKNPLTLLSEINIFFSDFYNICSKLLRYSIVISLKK